MKNKILKFIDSFLGRVLVWCLPKPKPYSKRIVKNILFLRPGGIGDAVLLVPVIQFIKKHYPEAVISVLAEKRNAAVFAMCLDVDNVMYYDRFDLLTVLRGDFDVIIDTEQWHRLTAVVARLIKSKIKIGYGTNERKKLYTHVVEYSHDRYELDSFYDLLRPLGVMPPDATSVPFLKIPAVDMAAARQQLGLLAGHSYVVLFPGASIPERRWGTEKFHSLAEMLVETGVTVVVVGGKEDYLLGDKIVSGIDGVNLAGEISLVESSAVVAKSVLLISGDSGVLHIGAGLGTPTVSLFGPGIADKWAPIGERHVVINHQLHCSPCTRFGTTPPCPVGAKCIQDITVDEVFAAAQKLIKF